MNLKTTFFLLLLSGGCVGLYFKGRDLAPRVGLPVPATSSPSASAVALALLEPGSVTRIAVGSGTEKDRLELKADAPARPLQLAGNWPTRGPEVEELKTLLTHLESRFAPIPSTDGLPDEDFGLGKGDPKTVVTVTVRDKIQVLTFGQPSAKPGENPFTRPTYLRVGDNKELLRLGPDVMPVLARKADYYRKRQLFPDVERVRFDDAGSDSPAAVPVVADAVTEIDASGPAGPYSLSRIKPTPKPAPPEGKPAGDATLTPAKLADAWRLSAPLADRVDPSKLKALLTAVPDLWVEKFLEEGDLPKAGLDAKDKPMALTLKLAAGGDRTLLVGKTSRVNTKTEPGTPTQPGMPAMPKIVEEKFYYGKLANNPQLFEIKGDKLAAIFFNDSPPDTGMTPEAPVQKVAVDELRDPNLLRFDTERATRIDVTRPEQPELLLTKSKDAAKKERWDLEKPFVGQAEATPVADLLRPLSALKATKADILDRPPLLALLGGFARLDLSILGLDPGSATVVRVTADGEQRAIYIGKRDAARKKVFVRVEGQDRINVVSDDFLAALDKQPRTYRSLKLFDLGENRIGSLEVQRGTAETYALREVRGATTKWELDKPVKAEADESKASGAVSGLASLTASEYVFDPLTEREKATLGALFGSTGLAALQSGDGFGLKNPTLKVFIHFAGPNPSSEQTLIVGKAREDKPDQYYAQIGGSPTVFAIAKSAVETLNAGSVALLPTQLWSGASVTSATIKKGTEEPFTVTKADENWKIVAPFESAIDTALISPLAGDLGSVNAVKYEAHESADLAKFGLDKPAVTLTFTAKEKGLAPDAKEETKTRTLLIGAAAGPAADPAKKTYYAKLADKPAIFTVSESLFADANKSALDLVSKNLLSIGSGAITKLQAGSGADSVTLVKDGADWKPEGAAFPLDKPTVEAVLRSVANLTAKSFAAYGPKVEWAKYGLDDAAKPAKVTVTAGDKGHVVLLGRETEDKAGRYARVDAGAGAAVLPLSAAKQLAQGKLDFVDKSFVKFDPSDLTGIRITRDGKTIELKSDVKGWKIEAPIKEKADQPTLEELTERLTALRVERVAAVDAKDLAPFGLDKPAAVVLLDRFDSKGKESRTTLKIGNKVDDKSPDRFIAAEGSNIIGVVNGNLAAKLLADPVAFRDLTLANFVNADRILVETPEGKRTFVKSVSGWKLTEPVKADADDEPLRELHDGFAKLRAEEFVDEGADDEDLEEYGLDKPTHWRLFNGDKEVLHLLVGGKEKGGSGLRRYAMLAGDDKVCLLDLGTSAKLGREYRKRALWEPLDVATASAVVISSQDGGPEVALHREAAGWADVVKPGTKVKAEAVTDFLDCVASLKADRFVADANGDAKLYGLQPPERVITVTTPSGKRTIELGRLDDAKRVYARVPGESAIVLLGEKDTERLRRGRGDFGK